MERKLCEAGRAARLVTCTERERRRRRERGACCAMASSIIPLSDEPDDEAMAAPSTPNGSSTKLMSEGARAHSGPAASEAPEASRPAAVK